MKSIAFFLLFAATMLVAIVFGEPVNYRQNQRARASAKQTVKVEPAEGSENDERDGKSEQVPQGNVQILNGPYYIVKSFPNGPLLVVPLNEPLDQSNNDSTTVESTTSTDDLYTTTDGGENVNAGGPYPPSGWKPTGPLLVLPNEPRPATTTELPTTEQPTTVQPTTQSQQKNPSGRLTAQKNDREEIAVADNAPENAQTASDANVNDDAEEIETNESKKSNANGKVESENSSETDDEADETSTETQAATTQQPSSKLETTSEPDAEAVDVGQQPKSFNVGGASQPPPPGPGVPPFVQSGHGAFIVQLPDGSLQRFVFVPASNPVLSNANLQPNAFVPVATSPFQQLAEPQPAQQPFGHNPIVSPRVVTFSSQYQAFK